MFQAAYEEIVRFASEGDLADELTTAKAEYVQRTGELFESDPSFERRIGSFLEWYVLDRPIGTTQKTPAELYVESVAEEVDEETLAGLQDLTRSKLSLFEFRKFREDEVAVVHLLTGAQERVFERRRPVGLESRDIMEARLVPYEGRWTFSDAFYTHPRAARRSILRAVKAFKKSGADPDGLERLDLVHRVAYYANRCERYAHVAPKEIYSELSWLPSGATP